MGQTLARKKNGIRGPPIFGALFSLSVVIRANRLRTIQRDPGENARYPLNSSDSCESASPPIIIGGSIATDSRKPTSFYSRFLSLTVPLN